MLQQQCKLLMHKQAKRAEAPSNRPRRQRYMSSACQLRICCAHLLTLSHWQLMSLTNWHWHQTMKCTALRVGTTDTEEA